ncbi:unnamed protein product [Musa acuminata var. zebrina]
MRSPLGLYRLLHQPCRLLHRVAKVQHRVLPASFLGRALLHDPKSFTYGYLDEKLVDTGLTKFLGLCPSALSRYLEIASACSTSSAPFTTKRSPSMRARDQ